MATAESEIFRPKKRVRRVREEPSFRYAVLGRLGGFARRVARRAGKSFARIAVRPPGAYSRRCAVVVRYVQLDGSSKPSDSRRASGKASGGGGQGSAGAAQRLFLAYMEKPGAGRDELAATLYGAAPTTRGELRGRMLEPLDSERHQFRIIIGPENADKLDLTAFIRELMRRVERDLGRKLIWSAANHYDTDDHHVHLLIRGKDREGREVRLPREYVKHGLRHRAQELATEELGPRTALDYERQLKREVQQQRLTLIDRRLGKREVHGLITAEGLRPHERERLRVLEGWRLAKTLEGEGGRVCWRMAEGWQAQLRQDGERGDLIKQMHRALRGDPARYHLVRRAEPLPHDPFELPNEVTGRVVARQLDERFDLLCALVETPSGACYRMPLWANEADVVHEGDLVRGVQLQDSWHRPLDEALVACAGRDGGTLDEERVGAALNARLEQLAAMGLAHRDASDGWVLDDAFGGPSQPTGIADEAVDTLLLKLRPARGRAMLGQDLTARVRGRLNQLTRLGIVRRTSAGERRVSRWHVPADLQSRLAQLEQQQPKARIALHRIELALRQQVTYLGPTWLDRVEPTGPGTFAGDLRDLKAQRAQFLAARRLRGRDLRSVERLEIQRQMGAKYDRSGARAIEGFVGDFVKVVQAPSGSRYAVIVGPTELAVVHVERRDLQHRGKAVRLAFEQNTRGGKRIAVQSYDRSRAVDAPARERS